MLDGWWLIIPVILIFLSWKLGPSICCFDFNQLGTSSRGTAWKRSHDSWGYMTALNLMGEHLQESLSTYYGELCETFSYDFFLSLNFYLLVCSPTHLMVGKHWPKPYKCTQKWVRLRRTESCLNWLVTSSCRGNNYIVGHISVQFCTYVHVCLADAIHHEFFSRIIWRSDEPIIYAFHVENCWVLLGESYCSSWW